MYSNYEVYPKEYDEIPIGTSCYTCNKDCPGLAGYYLKSGDYDE